jgi:hypothetical protein
MSANIATIGSGYVETLQMPAGSGPDILGVGPARHPARGARQPDAGAAVVWRAAPLGRSVVMGKERVEVIGILADGKYENYTEAQAAVLYLSLDQRPASSATLHVRSRMEPSVTLAAVRRELAASTRTWRSSRPCRSRSSSA